MNIIDSYYLDLNIHIHQNYIFETVILYYIIRIIHKFVL